jgi:hypothetical protein
LPKLIGTLRLFATQGTKNLSDVPLELLDLARVYTANVMNFGHIDQSLAWPPGKGIRGGDAQVKVADTTRELRAAWDEHTLKRRLGRLDLFKTSEVSSGAQVDALEPEYTGEIRPGNLPSGEANIVLHNVMDARLDKPVPPLGNRDNWPDLPPGIETVFIPFRFGRLDSFDSGESSFLPQGACDCPYLGPAYARVDAPGDSTDGELILDSADAPILLGFDYAVARHKVWDVMRVYRKGVTEGYYALVDPSEYDIVEIPKTIGGILYTITVLRFLEQQDDGTLIRGDISGVNSRGSFGESPWVLDAIENQEIRYLVDHLVNFIYYIEIVESKIERFNSQSFYELRQILIDRGLLHDIDIDAANFDEPLTPRKVINAMTSGLVDFKQDRSGRITVAADELTNALDSYTPSITEDDVVEDSWDPEPPSVTYNRLRVRYAPYGKGQWGYEWIIDNIDDQAELAQDGESGANVIEELVLELPGVRDDATAFAIGKEVIGYFTLRSWSVRFKLKLPEWVRTISLGQTVSVTHRDGISEFASYDQVVGWFDEPFKNVGLVHDLDGQLLGFVGQRRYPSSELNLQATFNPLDGHPERASQSSQPPSSGSDSSVITAENESATLPASRRIVAGDGIVIEDGGPSSTLVISATSSIERGDVAFVTGSLANGAREEGSFALGKSSLVHKIVASHKSRIRFYSTSTGRDADATRSIGTLAAWGVGLLLELLLDQSSLLTFLMQPPANCLNRDDTVSTTIYYSVTNISGATTAITVTVSRLLIES